MKKFLPVAIVCVLFFTSTVFAAPGIIIDGNVQADEVIAYDETGYNLYIRLSEAGRLFGVTATFKNDGAVIEKNGHSLLFEAGKNQFIMDGLSRRDLTMEGLIIQDGEPYVALRPLSEATGAVISWSAENNAAEVTTGAVTMPETAAAYFENVQVLDQSTVRIGGEKVIYIDPYHIVGTPQDADVILICHSHDDHLDWGSIKNVMKDSTVVYLPADAMAAAAENGVTNAVAVAPGEVYTEGEVAFETVHAYNLPNELETRMYHPKESNWVGYVVAANGYTYYAAGDTDFVPELEGLQTDVAFIPVDGVFNMTAAEAALMANAINPKVAVPYHYVNFGSEDMALDFVREFVDLGAHLARKPVSVIMAYKMY
ncbi:MAG: MBL fold metallo-hydrolase [Clostridiales bacterium]|jgi:L-ascorbate metabolism protein UlaG (beta-lactamase superfamily)|nr:MBL fold metallo-hydrolase [Clostridiales bacterium]